MADIAGTLLSDGAAAYARFARERPALVHAQCWSHTRRLLFRIGRGLAGFCPAPALVAAAAGHGKAILFCGAMLVRMFTFGKASLPSAVA